jgi:hypothetical protein
VQHRERARVVRFADDPLVAGRLFDHDEVVRRDGPQAHGVGGVRLVRPVPVIVGELHEPRFGEHRQDLLHVHLAERLVARERQLERCALHVVEQNVQVVRVD